MILQKATDLLNHPSATPSAAFFVCGVVAGTLFSGSISTMGANFVWIVHARWWALILVFLVWMGGTFYFRLETYKIDRETVLKHETINELREEAERDVAAEWRKMKKQNLSCEDLHRALSVDQRKLVEERRELRINRATYLRYAEQTAEKLKRKSKSLVGKLAEKDPNRAKKYATENARLIKHLESAPELTKPAGLRPPTIKR